MAIIYSYPNNSDLLPSDILVGTSTKIYLGKVKNETKNFSLDALSYFTSTSQYNTLNTVLNNGNNSQLDANIGGLGLYDLNGLAWAKVKVFTSEFRFYSAHYPLTPIVAFDENSLVFNNMSYTSSILTGSPTANRTYTLPNNSGTIALTSDIPAAITLTTTGTSGAATLIGNTLNIPVYTGGSPTIPTLDEVLNEGNTSLNDAKIGALYLYDDVLMGYGGSQLSDNVFSTYTKDGNPIFSADPTGYYGFYNGLIEANLVFDSITAFRQYQLPDVSGTIALTSDIPSLTGYVQTTRTISTTSPLQGGGDLSANRTLSILQSGTSQDGYLSLTDWNTFNNKQNSITLTTTGSGAATFISNVLNIPTPPTAAFTSLTTTGSSGSSTLIGGVLNVPTYTLAGLGGVPTSRTLTINGTTYDLSADRSWSVGTVTSVTATGPITSTGGAAPVISTSMATNKLIGRSTAGTGVMEEITVGSGLSLSGGTLSASSLAGSILHGTASGTDAYTVTITGATAYSDGDAYLIRFTNGNTTSATLNINGFGAVQLYRNNDGQVIGGDILANGEMLCIYNSTSNIFQCIGVAPNTLLAYVTNAETTTITRGQPVYVSGGVGDRIKVKLAYNTSDSTSAQTIGVVSTASIAANQKGIIIVQGQLDNLSLFPTSTWADGDYIYLGATPGSITNVKPVAPNHLVYLGYVTTASNGSSGRMYVKVQNGYELQELHNVYINPATLANNDLIQYNSSTSLWVNKSLSAAGIQAQLNGTGFVKASGTTISYDNTTYYPNPTGTTSQYIRGDGSLATFPTIPGGTVTSVAALTLGTSGTDLSSTVANPTTTPVITLNVPTASATNRGALSSADWATFNSKFTLPSLTNGSVIFSNGTTLAENNANFFWDDSNSRLGLGTTTPSAKLHVDGSMFLLDSATGVSTITFPNGPQIEANGPGGYFKSGLVHSSLFGPTAGNVGIGTTSPSAKLDVNGVIRGVLPDPSGLGGITAKLLSYSPSPYGLVFRGYSSGAHSIQSQRESNDAQMYPLILQPNGSNVGIGTVTPSALLDVNGDALINGITVGRGAGNDGSNTIIGNAAFINNTSGQENVVIGANAGSNITTGNANIILGRNAGYNLSTGSNNTIIGNGNSINPAANPNNFDATLSIGKYNSISPTQQLPHIWSPNKINTDTTATVIELRKVEYAAMFVEYVISDTSGNIRAGYIKGVWNSDASSIKMTEDTTSSIGDTSDYIFNIIDIDPYNLALQITSVIGNMVYCSITSRLLERPHY